jgi:hypothetical protein
MSKRLKVLREEILLTFERKVEGVLGVSKVAEDSLSVNF